MSGCAGPYAINSWGLAEHNKPLRGKDSCKHEALAVEKYGIGTLNGAIR
jgi:hypothetical protein